MKAQGRRTSMNARAAAFGLFASLALLACSRDKSVGARAFVVAETEAQQTIDLVLIENALRRFTAAIIGGVGCRPVLVVGYSRLSAH